MVKCKELTYMKTFNLGNYESEKIGVTIELEGIEQNYPEEIYPEIKKRVHQMHEHQEE